MSDTLIREKQSFKKLSNKINYHLTCINKKQISGDNQAAQGRRNQIGKGQGKVQRANQNLKKRVRL